MRCINQCSAYLLVGVHVHVQLRARNVTQDGVTRSERDGGSGGRETGAFNRAKTVLRSLRRCVNSQLDPEDDGEHGEDHRHGQTHVQVEQDGGHEGDPPDHLKAEGGSVYFIGPYSRVPTRSTVPARRFCGCGLQRGSAPQDSFQWLRTSSNRGGTFLSRS